MPILIAILIFVLLFFASMILTIGSARDLLLERMQLLGQVEEPTHLPDMTKSLRERVLQPLWGKVFGYIRHFAPQTMLKDIDERLAQAGHPWRLRAEMFLALQLLSAIAGLALGLAAWNSLSAGPAIKMILLIAAVGMGLIVPGTLVDSRAGVRKTAISKALPNVIDLLVVSVEAGMGLDGAIRELLAREDGPLTAEFEQALTEMRMGKSRAAAWRSLAERSQVRDLHAFMAAICQAEELGSGIAPVLRTHSQSLRVKRSLRVKELAAKIPIKMLFPLIFFIFPAMFVVILGPGAIALMRTYGGIGGP